MFELLAIVLVDIIKELKYVAMIRIFLTETCSKNLSIDAKLSLTIERRNFLETWLP